MRLYDTLRRAKREFLPLRGNTVRIYTCGPSVYSRSHIGNFRTYLFEDILVRYLEYRGYRVKRVMNITDVEDKAIEMARKEGKSLAGLEKDKIRSFFSDFHTLGMLKPQVVAMASDYIPWMIRLIRRICRNGYCIDRPEGVYFDTRRSEGYGSLLNMEKPAYLGTARCDDYSREGIYDFRLWKRWTRGDGAARWKSPFGDGRPGWHIECSAISKALLGIPFDIHCGGSDNIYPHHENEIAQSKAADGKVPARFWMHARHLTVGGKKMSKRTGSVFYVGELIGRGMDPRCLRFYLISERYRKPLDFTIRRFERKVCDCHSTSGMISSLMKVRRAGDGKRGARIAQRILEGFEGAMDDDLNTALAFRKIFAQMGEAGRLLKQEKLTREDAVQIIRAIRKADSVLGVF
ncbi:MAG: cysteine--tRNA ligase [Candidatus Micrarchaeia archaeon]